MRMKNRERRGRDEEVTDMWMASVAADDVEWMGRGNERRKRRIRRGRTGWKSITSRGWGGEEVRCGKRGVEGGGRWGAEEG